MSVTIETAVLQRGFPPSWSLGDFSLRPLQHNDVERWSEYLSDPRVTAHTSWGNVDLRTIDTLVDRCISEYSAGTSCRWALADSRDALVGTCGFSQWSLPHCHAELVYDLSPEFWRRGLISRAVAVVLDWAFRTVGFNRVHALSWIRINHQGHYSRKQASSARACYGSIASRTVRPAISSSTHAFARNGYLPKRPLRNRRHTCRTRVNLLTVGRTKNSSSVQDRRRR